VWWAIERLGLPTVLCGLLWYGFTGVVEQSRSDAKEMNVQVLSTTKEVTTALVQNNEIQRRQLDQQEDTERAIERQTVVFDKLCDRLGVKEEE
jgi:apolipoprotein N-acyltransferase